MRSDIDTLWVLVAAVFVFGMQAGFCCLESGFVRAKNGINVALKNLTDFFASTLLFWAYGFGVMFGTSVGGWFGSDGYFPGQESGADRLVFFLFQLAFCSTAATIVSGGVAERMRFSVYVFCASLVSGLVYPYFGHWAWATHADGTAAGWLARLGFHDFAGSTVVHSVGGWVTFACLLHLGPRNGRFEPRTSKAVTQGSNLPLAVLGCFILLFGWIGFNGGSTLALDHRVPGIISNTLLAAAAGAIAGVSWARLRSGIYEPAACINGALAGLVAITAGCDCMSAPAAALVGAVGGILAVCGTHWLERWRIDDAVGAFPVHGIAGIWGTLAVGLLSRDLPLPWWHQFGIQLVGVVTCAVWAFGITWIALAALKKFQPLRVSAERERLGLNVAEHGASTEILDLLTEMETQRASGDFSRRVPAEPHTEVGQIAQQYNRVLDRVNEEGRRAALLNQELRTATATAEAGARAKAEFLSVMSHEFRTPLNAVNGMAGILLESPLDAEQRDCVRTIRIASESLLHLVRDTLEIVDLETGEVKFTRAPYAPASLVAEVVENCEVAARDKGLALQSEVTLDPALRQFGDGARVAQVLEILVGNAIKFSEAGVVTIRARRVHEAHVSSGGAPQMTCGEGVPGGADHGYIAYVVSDTGVGIPRERQAQLFQHFRQADSSTRRRYGGVGLGLALCRGLVTRMHGAVGFHSEPGRGSTFWFTIPFVEPNAPAKGPVTAATPELESAGV